MSSSISRNGFLLFSPGIRPLRAGALLWVLPSGFPATRNLGLVREGWFPPDGSLPLRKVSQRDHLVVLDYITTILVLSKILFLPVEGFNDLQGSHSHNQADQCLPWPSSSRKCFLMKARLLLVGNRKGLKENTKTPCLSQNVVYCTLQ